MAQESTADLVVQKLRTLIADKAAKARDGSPDRYRLSEMLELSDDALLDTIYHQLDPNPDRVGCPPQETLRALAMRTRPLSDPVWDHIMTCAPCGTDVREMGRHRPATSARVQGQRYRWAVLAVLLLSTGLGTWWLTRSSRGAVTVTGDLRPYAQMRSDGPPVSTSALELPRRQVRLTLVLPNGSEPGPYALEVRNADGRTYAAASGTATLDQFITRLETVVDLRSVPPGPARLAVRRDSEGWQVYPVRIQ